jgi:anaerobic ribonucleoside-triphosphate reductase activating protein
MNRQTIRLARVITGLRSNGPGRRDVYWTAGCSIRCPGCINPHYLEASAGVEVGIPAVESLIKRRCTEIEGITFTGGEPTDQAESVAPLSAYARGLGLSVVIFTGRTITECEANPVWKTILSHCDLLVAGPFLMAERHRTLPLLGSANQRLHFLTDRYSMDDLQCIPDLELLVNPDSLSAIGVYVPQESPTHLSKT